MKNSHCILDIVERLQLQQEKAFMGILCEKEQRYQSRLYNTLESRHRMIGIPDDIWINAWKMLENFINYYTGDFEALNAIIQFDTEDDSLQIKIHQKSIDISLYYLENIPNQENFEEAYLSYREGDNIFLTNDTSINIAKTISKILNE